MMPVLALLFRISGVSTTARFVQGAIVYFQRMPSRPPPATFHVESFEPYPVSIAGNAFFFAHVADGLAPLAALDERGERHLLGAFPTKVLV